MNKCCSIIIPTYNRAALLDRCLKSICLQTFKNFEVIVIDDGSTDSTRAVCEKYQSILDLSYIYQENWGGPAKPRNVGIKNSKAEYIAFLDSDDWWDPEKLSKCIQTMEKGADLVYHEMFLRRSRPTRSCFQAWIQQINLYFNYRVRSQVVNAPVFNDLLHNGNKIVNSSVVVRRYFLEIVGGISEDRSLIASEDYDLWLRIAIKTDAFVHIDECLGYYSNGDDNISSAKSQITNIKHLRRLYSQQLKHFNNKLPAHFSYSLSRAYEKLGSHKAAFFYIILSLKTSSSIDLKLRIYLSLVRLNILYITHLACKFINCFHK